jgi:hypothetical protein
MSETLLAPKTAKIAPPATTVSAPRGRSLLLANTHRAAPSIVHEVLRSQGQPLDPASRSFAERGLRRDFGHVRVHAGPAAAQAARALGARAFSQANHVVFGDGHYAPQTRRGRWLLTHELAHVAQGRAGGASAATAEIERDASQAATAVMRGRGVYLQRQHDGSQIHLFGEPENVPEITYISTQGSAGFLNEAADYHQAWGLTVQRVGSIEQMVTHLAQSTSRLGRMRFVTHAADIGVFTSLFTGEPLLSLQGDRVSAYAESDAAGLAHDTQMSINVPLDAIMGEIRSVSPALLRPFGLEATGVPTGELDEYFRRVIQLVVLRQSRTAANGAQFDPMITALPTVIDRAVSLTVQQFAPPPAPVGAAPPPGVVPPVAAPVVTAQDVRSLQGAITAAMASLGMTFTGVTVSAEQASQVRQANRAIAGGFRQTLNTARARFDAESWIDIRGCNAGDDTAYLHAVARFFGTAPALPHVSAPKWFQIFPILSLRPLADAAAVTAVAGDANVTTAVDRWSPLTGARSQLELLRLFYQTEILRRARLAQLTSAPPGTGLLGAGPSLGFLPFLASDPFITGLPNTAADRAAVSLLMFPVFPRLSEPQLFPSRFGPTLGTFTLRDPGIGIAQGALDRLNAPNAELNYYLDSALVLPVFQGGNQQHFRMYVKADLQGQAISHWLGSQWTTAAPGLAALQAAPNAANARRIQALVETHDEDAAPTAEMVFPPDPRFWAQINQI